MANSQRAATQKGHRYQFKRFDKWCRARGIVTIAASIKEIAEFLTSLFKQGMTGGLIKTVKSALSASLPDVNNQSIGHHPRIIQLMKGFANIRPATYKVPPRWEVDVVIKFIADLPADWHKMNLTLHTWILAMLFALTSAGRCSELCSLRLDRCQRTPEGILFYLENHKKNHSSSIYPGTIFIPNFPENPRICPMTRLDGYLEATSYFRNVEENWLFRSISQPEKGITAKTFARWVSFCIRAAVSGDTSPSTQSIAHQARGLAATKASMQGRLTLVEIMAGADWRTDSVFRRFYKNPHVVPKFGRAVLKVD